MTRAMELAATYDRSVLALQHGDATALRQLNQWLDVFWVESSPNVAGKFVTRSRSGDGNRRIEWSESQTIVYGTIPGQEGCFRVPVEAFLPSEFVPGTIDQPVAPLLRHRPDMTAPAAD